MNRAHILFLDTESAQKAFETHFPELSRNLRSFYNTKNNVKQSQHINNLEQNLLDKFHETSSKIKRELEYHKSFKSDTNHFQFQKNYRLSNNLPHIKQVMQLFNKIDELAALIESNYQSEIFTLKEKKQKEYQLQRFILKLTHFTRDISNRSRNKK